MGTKNVTMIIAIAFAALCVQITLISGVFSWATGNPFPLQGERYTEVRQYESNTDHLRALGFRSADREDKEADRVRQIIGIQSPQIRRSDRLCVAGFGSTDQKLKRGKRPVRCS